VPFHPPTLPGKGGQAQAEYNPSQSPFPGPSENETALENHPIPDARDDSTCYHRARTRSIVGLTDRRRLAYDGQASRKTSETGWS
jgi:hypothetical protein